MVVEAWLQRAAAARPQTIALQGPHGSLTYAQLHLRALAGAQELWARGVRQGARVAIALPPGLDFACALHACMMAGAIAVPVDLRLRTDERQRIAAGARIVLEEPLAAPGRGSAPEQFDRPEGATHDLSQTVALIHTSGTTSAPRPVELTYGNFLWSALGSAVALGVDPQERWLCALPLSHVGGLSILMRSAIYATTAVVHQRFEVQEVCNALEQEQITLISLVATTLARLLDGGLHDPPTLRCALTGGGPVPDALISRARAAGVPVSQTYGLTEACSQVTTVPVAELGLESGGPMVQDDAILASTPASRPLFCTQVRIASDGEILLAGPTLSPSLERPDGWLHTGDLGSIDELGGLRVIGRKSDTIISGGENVAPAEVEAGLETHPDVIEAAVLARPDTVWGESVAAIVVARPGALPSSEQLRAHCAMSLASYKVPKQIRITDEPLPRTRSGKLLRRALT